MKKDKRISNLKREKDDAISYCFMEDGLMRKIGNFKIRTPKQKGQIDFYVLVNGIKFIGYNIFEKYGDKNMDLRYFYCLDHAASYYKVDDLINDLKKINCVKKITYVMIVFTKIKKVFILTLDQLKKPAPSIFPFFLENVYLSDFGFIDEKEDEININEIRRTLKKIVIIRNILHCHWKVKNVEFIKNKDI